MAAACVATGADRSRTPGGGAGGGSGIGEGADGSGVAAQPASAPPVDAGEHAAPVLRWVPIYSDTVLLILDQIRFAPHSARLPPAVDSILEPVAKTLHTRPDMRIAVQGHADTGEGKRAKWLSEQRARGVRDRLIKLGASPNQLLLESYGASVPLAEAQPDGGKTHSRVQLKFLDFEGTRKPSGDAEAPP